MSTSTDPETRLTFPPFPAPPNGIPLIPFSHFKERGIQMFPADPHLDNDVERDGLGIPTVELRVKHDTDACKTETKRNSRAKKAAAAAKMVPSAGAGGGRKEWWEAWMEAEDLRGAAGSYNPNTSPIDRLYEAAADFRKGRPWPPAYTGIAAMWDQFRLFVGLLSNTPVWTRTDKPPQENDSDSEDSDDSLASDTEPAPAPAHTSILTTTPPPKKPPPRPRARPPYALYGAAPVPVSSDAQVKDLLSAEHARREERVVTFLADPAAQLRVFLSSYMRKQGLIWAERNLINYPRLVGFFLRFVVRNRVFPEAGYARAWGEALGVVEGAQRELVLTSRIAKCVPDGLSLALVACWGAKAGGYKRLGAQAVEAGEGDGGENGDAAQTAVEKFEAELKAQNVQVIKTSADILSPPPTDADADADAPNDTDAADNAWANTAWPDPTTSPPSPNPTNTNTNPWSATSWPTSPSPNPDPDADADADADPDPNPNPWTPTPTQWDPPTLHFLPTFLGPTALPLTHTTGIVEWAVRRVVRFAPPPVPAGIPRSPVVRGGDDSDNGEGYGEAEAVELELERRFGKVVFGPWIGWDRAQDEMPHLAVPRVVEGSRGLVVGATPAVGASPATETGTEIGASPATAPATSSDESPDIQADADAVHPGPKPHDPFKDDITVLVEPGVLQHLSVGMGLGATWVQIAREGDFGEGKGNGKGKGKAGKKGKGGKGKGKEKERYWYIDELLMVLPSYHT